MKKSSSFAKSLSIKIILATSALLTVVVVSLVVSNILSTINNCKNNLDTQLHMTAQSIEKELKIIENLADNTIKTVGWMPVENAEQILKDLAISNPHIESAGIYFNIDKTKRTGLIIPNVTKDSTTGEIRYMLAQDEITLNAILRNFNSYISQYDIADVERHQSPWLGPYQNINGTIEFSYLAGTEAEYPETDILEVSITLNWLSDMLAEVKPYDNTEAFIMDSNSNLLCTTSKESELSVNDGFGLKVKVADDYLAKYKEMKTFDADFEENCIVDKKVMNNGWVLVAKCPLTEVFADVLVSLRNMVILMAISIFLLFLFCTKIIFKKAKPLVEFANASGSIAKGNFDTVLPAITENDEISLLRDSFANMQVSLKQYIKSLAEVTEKTQRMESELNIANGIQNQALHKSFPSNDCFDLYAVMRPAKEVGGDLYDFVIKDDKLYLCIGDVSGKGVPAALVMMTTIMIFRYICTNCDMSLREMAYTINNSLADGNDSDFFVTLFMACVDLKTREMKFCNCGHNSIIVSNAGGEAVFNNALPNIACGVFEGFNFVEESLQLEKDSRVILYTDGVNEATNSQNEEYGNHRLLEWANSAGNYANEKSLIEGLLSSVNDFAEGTPQSDDITILSVKIGA